jgi:hypothetical protein
MNDDPESGNMPKQRKSGRNRKRTANANDGKRN